MPLRWRLRHWLALHLPRWLAVALGIRRMTPVGHVWPSSEQTATVDPVDTGGGYRAKLRQQNPSVDPKEPGGGESSSAGNDHGWANCSMSSGATAMAYQQPYGGKTPWGGDLRHKQGDQSGGTDLYDVKDAWASYGETLTIKTGSGWGTLVDTHNAKRAIVIQGTGNVPGSATFDGGHACVIGPETAGDGDWLWGDPLVSDWQWVDPDKIRQWAQAWNSDISYAAGEKPPPPDPPPPDPPPVVYPIPDRYAIGYRAGVVDGANAEADRTFASWRPGGPFIGVPDFPGATWDGVAWGGANPSPPLWDRGRWDRRSWPGADPRAPRWSPGWPVPLGAVLAAQTPASWQTSGWAASVWRS